jgi:hypothetical protein
MGTGMPMHRGVVLRSSGRLAKRYMMVAKIGIAVGRSGGPVIDRLAQAMDAKLAVGKCKRRKNQAKCIEGGQKDCRSNSHFPGQSDQHIPGRDHLARSSGLGHSICP